MRVSFVNIESDLCFILSASNFLCEKQYLKFINVDTTFIDLLFYVFRMLKNETKHKISIESNINNNTYAF